MMRDVREEMEKAVELQRVQQKEMREQFRAQERERIVIGREQARVERERVQQLKLHHAQSKANERLVEELFKDGLIQDKDSYRLKLNKQSLIINGKEQPASVLKKYRELYEKQSGNKMDNKSRIEIRKNQ